MSGAYVKAALRMDAGPRRAARPVLLVHDGQNKQKVGKLRKNWHAVETHATAYADLILAVRSAYFIGNPASSFSANVVMIRRALGAAPTSSNLRVLDFPRPGSLDEFVESRRTRKLWPAPVRRAARCTCRGSYRP